MQKYPKNLTTSGFCEDTLSLALMIQGPADPYIELKSITFMAIAFDFGRACNFTRAYEMKDMVADAKMEERD